MFFGHKILIIDFFEDFFGGIGCGVKEIVARVCLVQRSSLKPCPLCLFSLCHVTLLLNCLCLPLPSNSREECGDRDMLSGTQKGLVEGPTSKNVTQCQDNLDIFDNVGRA